VAFWSGGRFGAWDLSGPARRPRFPACAAKISTPTWVSPEVVPTELGGGRRLRDAWAAPEVETASKMYLENLEQIDKKKTKMSPNQGPQHEGPDPEAY
jgi:hypothetical protein